MESLFNSSIPIQTKIILSLYPMRSINIHVGEGYCLAGTTMHMDPPGLYALPPSVLAVIRAALGAEVKVHNLKEQHAIPNSKPD